MNGNKGVRCGRGFRPARLPVSGLVLAYGDSMILAGAHIFAIRSLVVSSAYFRKLAHSAGVRNANFRKHAP